MSLVYTTAPLLQASPLEMVYKHTLVTHKELVSQHDALAALVDPVQLVNSAPPGTPRGCGAQP